MKLLNNVSRIRGRRPRSLRTTTLALLVPLAVLATACGGGDGESGEDKETPAAPPAATSGDPLDPHPLAKKEKLTIGMSSKLEPFAPLLMADYYGEFEKENLEIKFEFVPPNESTLLVAQGKLDGAYNAFNAGLFNTIAQGSPVRFVFPGVGQSEDSTQGFWINNKEMGVAVDKLTAQDFKGKKILMPSGDASPSAAHFYAYLKTLPGGDKIAPKDLDIQTLDSASLANALKSGAAAAVQVSSPHDKTLRDSDCCTYLKGAYPTETVSAYIFGPSMKDKKDAGTAFVRAVARTSHTYLAKGYRDDDKVMNDLAKVLELDIEVLKGIDELYWDPEFKTEAESNVKNQEFFRARGLLQYDKDLTPEDVYDTSYLEAIGVKP